MAVSLKSILRYLRWRLLLGYQASTTVNAPDTVVFNYMADFGRHHHWDDASVPFPGATVSPAVGTVFEGRGTIKEGSTSGPIYTSARVREEVIEFAPHERLTYLKHVPQGTSRMQINVTRHQAGTTTRLTLQVAEERGPLGWFFFLLLFPLILPVLLLVLPIKTLQLRNLLEHIKSQLDQF